MSKDLVKYVGVAACAYLLVYLAVHIMDNIAGVGLPMLFALMAIGTLLGGLSYGARACMLAGAVSAISAVIGLVTQPHSSGAAFAVSYLVAALVAFSAGAVLARRAKTQGVEPTA